MLDMGPSANHVSSMMICMPLLYSSRLCIRYYISICARSNNLPARHDMMMHKQYDDRHRVHTAAALFIIPPNILCTCFDRSMMMMMVVVAVVMMMAKLVI